MGARVQGEQQLANGDRIQVGPLEFEVRLQTAAEPRSPQSKAPKSGDTGQLSDTAQVGNPPRPAEKSTPDGPRPPHSPAPASGKKPPAVGERAAQPTGSEDEIMQWLNNAPSGPKSIYLELEPPSSAAASADTGEVSLDGTQPLDWPDSARPLPPCPPRRCPLWRPKASFNGH